MFESGQFGASVIFVATVGASLIGLFAAPNLIEKSLFRPYWFLKKRQYDTLYMSGFVHADIGHLLMNMVTFYFFAFPLERMIGTVPFIVLYALGLVLSHVWTLYRHMNNAEYATLGASGAISAVLFAFVVYDPTSSLFIIPIPIPIPAWFFAIAYLGYTWWASQQNRGRINHDAHFCGALTGLVFVLFTNPGAYGRLFSMFS